MARYTIEHACGHEERHHLDGNKSRRTRKQQWLAEQDCWECARAQQNAASAARAAEANLPKLTGSDSQIAWAVTIRDEALTDLEHSLSDTDLSRERVLAILLRETRARRWIDTRGDGPTSRLVRFCAPGEFRDLNASEDHS
ncbi:hypothetical protein [Nocardia sp. CNY236]|uniref:hypothetical protein n=1 Tax=Nocardia sp. CNY236 TaxID=1169152 RepID=UPI0003FC0016|nr:hypothetical protein [Nocardia sp. CNY236]